MYKLELSKDTIKEILEMYIRDDIEYGLCTTEYIPLIEIAKGIGLEEFKSIVFEVGHSEDYLRGFWDEFIEEYRK